MKNFEEFELSPEKQDAINGGDFIVTIATQFNPNFTSVAVLLVDFQCFMSCVSVFSDFVFISS